MSRFTTSDSKSRSAFIPAIKVSALAVGLMLASAADAVQFTYEGGVSGSFDSTFSYGVSRRLQEPDRTLIGITNGGLSSSVNEDDGDRNYKKGKLFANVLKGTHDLEIKYEGWSVFARGSYFIDFANRNKDFLGPIANDRLSQNARILDAFITKSFKVADRNVRVRAGNQVISWGESTFIPNSINSINSVDLPKLRSPGSELKEAFLPTSSLLVSAELTKNASMEAFVLFNHDKTRIDPKGSYWSNNDFISDDASKVFVGFGRRKDNTQPITNPSANPVTFGAFGPFDPAAAVWAPRSADRNASDSGQYGVTMRYLAPELNNTEFGIYYLNYHSRNPFISGIKGSTTSVLTGTPFSPILPTTVLANYFVQYPENIRLIGVSFNTQGPLGVALQGEVSYRPNQPLSLSGTELVLATLGAPNLVTGYLTIPGTVSMANPFGASGAAFVPNGTYLQGWTRVKMTQAQMTATKGIPNVLGADQAVLAGEVGVTRYGGLQTGQKYSGPATSLPATLQGAIAGQAGAVQESGFVTETSWGYRLVGRLEYSNLVFGANVAPRIAFNHDVKGVSQTFNEGVKSISIGTNFDWQRRFSLDFSYSGFFGGRDYCGNTVITPGQTTLPLAINGFPAFGRPAQGAAYCSSANPIKDRDFVSVVATYSF